MGCGASTPGPKAAADSSSAAPLEVTDRASLFGHLHASSAGDVAKVRACLCSYTPPAERLILRSAADFAALGTSKEAVHGACDPTFWAFGDFESVYNSFVLEPTDKERRVMGIEGVGSPSALLAAIESGAKSLKIGHLSLLMMEGKVATGEWHWIDEAKCVMHTATPKPALLRTEVRATLGVELKVVRHEQFAAGAESVGDLIIFDMDMSDVTKELGNHKVFCQDPSNYTIAPLSTLSDEMKAAIDKMLSAQLIAPTAAAIKQDV